MRLCGILPLPRHPGARREVSGSEPGAAGLVSGKQDLFVVGVGSSAGGIEALEQLFQAMPARPGMAFVLVAHLAPGKVSLLADIVGRFTSMPVVQARDGARVEADHVYVIAPSTALTLEQGRLRARPLGGAIRAGQGIDGFFASLAQDQGDHAIGVLLSGGGSDGTLGFKALKEAGGLTVAQGADHGAPRYGGMPGSAIGAGVVDLVLPVERMPEKLVAYVANFGTTLAELRADEGRRAGATVASVRAEICGLLRERVGHEFGGYKEKTFLRRVQRRMGVLQIVGVATYLERLREDPDEATLLFRDLLIGVTAFFRDPEAFEALGALALPRLLEGKGAGDVVRVWVPGCASGEEVYSLAVLLREHVDALPSAPKLQIFGTDIDERALTAARAGRFPAEAMEGMDPERLRRFFVEDAGAFVPVKEVRDACIFSTHSLVRDPPFSRIDLISCRNLLIYLDVELQAQVVPIFHYALRPGGHLFLGAAESVSQHANLFVPVDKRHRIFVRREHGGLHVRFQLPSTGVRAATASAASGPREPFTVAASLRRAVDLQVLERFAPAHVVADREGDVVYYSARTGKYLEPAAGVATRQLFAMARKGLRLDLRGAFEEALATRRPAARAGVAVEIEGRGVQRISLTVEPLEAREADNLFLVLFDDQGPPLTAEEAERGLSPGAPGSDALRLESELRDTRDRLQGTIEEYETALEELKAANEELVSMNEEFQSANEELETSKEELQSINEELQTVNQELGLKVDQLNHVNADLANVLDSTRIAVVFLDRGLRVRSFTPAVTGIFSLITSDQGRPVTDIVTNLDYDGLADDVRRVIATGAPLERRVARRDGSMHYVMHVLPYRDPNQVVSGALVTFVDVTLPVKAEQHQRLLVDELNHRVRNMLAVVSAIASQTLARTPEPATFAESFLGRIQALARSHGLLARDRWRDVGLREILRGEIVPYAGEPDGERVRIEGPAVLVKPKAALALGLIAHELATNALKHGALAAPDGRLRVAWAIERVDGTAGRALRLRWREEDGPPPVPKGGGADGFGSVLVSREVEHELHGTLRRELRPVGAEIEIVVPLEPLFAVEEAGTEAAGAVEGAGAGSQPAAP